LAIWQQLGPFLACTQAAILADIHWAGSLLRDHKDPVLHKYSY